MRFRSLPYITALTLLRDVCTSKSGRTSSLVEPLAKYVLDSATGTTTITSSDIDIDMTSSSAKPEHPLGHREGESHGGPGGGESGGRGARKR